MMVGTINMTDEGDKTCFVIAPIGESGSDTRERSDLVLEHIIGPAVKRFGYTPVRADEIDRPGIITSQVIQHVLDSPLVIADLTERNPNVFYELAIRHLTRKPFIQIMKEGEGVPFDVAATRIIAVDHTHLGRAADAREKIEAQLKSLEENPEDLETPISTSVDLQHLRQSEVPQDRSLADLLSAISDVRNQLSILAEMASIGTGRANVDAQLLSERLYAKIDEAIATTQALPPRRRAVSASRINYIISLSRMDAYGFLVVLSVFREDAPWIYEVGMDVYRKVVDGNLERLEKFSTACSTSSSYRVEFYQNL